MEKHKDVDGMPQTTTKGLKTFTDEHGNSYTLERVDDLLIKFDPNANVRPMSEYAEDKWGASDLVPKLRETGGVPKTEPAYHLDTQTGELTILRGNRRYIARAELRSEAPKDERYRFILARIYRDLSPEARALVKMDHAASERKLSRLGLHNSVIECKKIGLSEQRTCAVLRGAFNDSLTADKNPGVPNDDPKVFAQYRGFIRTCRWANDISVLEEAWVKKQATPGETFPTNEVIERCHKAFLEDKKNNALLTKDADPKRAPQFTEMWEGALKDRAVAVAEGKTRTKSTAARNPTQIAALAFTSTLSEAIKSDILRKAKNPAAWPDVIDPILAKLERFMSDEDRAKLQMAIEGKTDIVASAASAPVAEQAPAKKTTGRKVKA